MDCWRTQHRSLYQAICVQDYSGLQTAVRNDLTALREEIGPARRPRRYYPPFSKKSKHYRHTDLSSLRATRNRNTSVPASWLEAATASGVPEWRTFATGMKREKASILAALTYKWSQGQVEGQIHRLKLIKRQAYGRARFDLLRYRVLACSA